MVRTALLLICLISVFITSASALTLTLDQCLERGLELNSQLQAARLAVDEAGMGIWEARGAFLPTLRADYRHSKLDNQGVGEKDSDYLSQNSDSFTLSLSQPLYSGQGSVAGLKKAYRVKDYRDYQLRAVEAELIRDIRASFFQLLQADQLVEKWTQSINRLQKQQEIAQAWVGEQLATRLRLLEINVELSNVRQQLASAEALSATARARLEELLLIAPDEQLQLSGSLGDEVPVSCDAVNDCLDLALAGRPELKLAELDILMAEQDLKMVRARNLPRITADASWVNYQREYDTAGLPEDDREYYTLSLNMSMQPFQGGRNIAAWKRQKIALERLRHELERKRLQVETEVRTRLEELKEGRSRLASAEIGLQEALEAYEFADRSAKLGVSSLNTLLDAELRLSRAEINRINAVNILQQARVKLDYAIGGRTR